MADVKVWRYVIPSESSMGGWAIFLLDSTGYFSTVSDYGNYAYRWPAHGVGDFRAFLCGLDRSYVLGKLAPEQRYDGDKTEAFVRETIISLRRDGTFDREEARAEWAVMQDADFDSEVGFADWLRETKIGDAWEMAIYSYSGQARAFYDRVWPRLVKVLQEAMASEEKAA